MHKLLSILTFNPTCRYYHTLYRRLLGRYLEHKYADMQKAQDKFDRLIAVCEKACEICQPISELYTLLELKEIAEELAEIYDRK